LVREEPAEEIKEVPKQKQRAKKKKRVKREREVVMEIVEEQPNENVASEEESNESEGSEEAESDASESVYEDDWIDNEQVEQVAHQSHAELLM